MNGIKATLVGLFLTLAGIAPAVDIYWNGSVDGEVTNTANWNGGVLPTFSDTAIITNTPNDPNSADLCGASNVVCYGTVGWGAFANDATFHDNSFNQGVINSNAVFNDSSYNDFNANEIFGNATFNDNSWNGWYVVGNATFNDNSVNYGMCISNTVFNNNSVNDGSYGGFCEYVPIVFNDNSRNINGGWVVVEGVFNDRSYNDASGGAYATFNNSSSNGPNGTVNVSATFMGNSVNYRGMSNAVGRHGSGIFGTEVLGIQ